jgi:hypothetical protein
MKRVDPLSGSSFACPSAGSQSNEQVVVDLDEPDPVIRNITAEGGFGDPYFRYSTLTLEKDEVITFSIQALAFKADYKWHLEATVRSDEEESLIRIPGAYSTTARVGSYGASWTWDWDADPEQLVPEGESGA